MNQRDDVMVEARSEAMPTVWVELERSMVTPERVRHFVRGAAGTEVVARNFETAPLSFALVLRRGHGPEAAISPRAFAIHGGHDIEMHAPIRVGETYIVRARIERIFRKTGRSGAMTIVERRVRIHDRRDDLASEITDRQIVRWKPTPGDSRTDTRQPSPAHPHAAVRAPAATSPAIFDESLEVGESLGPFRRQGPKRLEISRWADALRDRETLFHDRDGSHALGYADLVVPGPMQSAFVDHLLHTQLPDWQTTRLNMTFRQSLLASEPLEIEGIVVDSEGDARTLEILIRNAVSGETASVGTATLKRA